MCYNNQGVMDMYKDQALAAFQMKNCAGCRFADKKAVGSGTPCCTYGGKLEYRNNVCQTRR